MIQLVEGIGSSPRSRRWPLPCPAQVKSRGGWGRRARTPVVSSARNGSIENCALPVSSMPSAPSSPSALSPSVPTTAQYGCWPLMPRG